MTVKIFLIKYSVRRNIIFIYINCELKYLSKIHVKFVRNITRNV